MYPHNIHPALVPGVSIEDQKVKYGVDKPILFVVGGLVVAFVIWGVIAPEQVFDVSSAALDWVMRNLGWIFTALATFLMFLLLILAFSKYGKIPLGGRNQAVDAPRLNSSLSISRGVAPPRICRGVSLSSFCTHATCSGVTVAKSVPFL